LNAALMLLMPLGLTPADPAPGFIRTKVISGRVL
jgi:hypothetical protein